jgi:hypothetical protein
MAEQKTRPTNESVVEFLNAVPDEHKRQDCFTLLEMMGEITGSEPKLWGSSMVGFGSYHYKYASGHEGDTFLTGFSPRKQNLVFYIMAGFDQYEELLARLGKHTIGKSCLYVKRLSDVDLPTLRTLIQASVDHMIETNPSATR